MVKELIKFTPKASPKSPLIEMSLTIDIVRGKVKGTLVKHVDDTLGVQYDNGN